jgi:hypothetical protein
VEISLFKSKFGKDSSEFRSLEEVNDFVEERLGSPLRVTLRHTLLCSIRGLVFRHTEVSADKTIDKALSE